MRARKYDEKGQPLEHPESSLFRRLRIWAQTWRRCPKKGCRRARRCLRFDDCAGVSNKPYWPSERDKRLYWNPIRALLRAEGDGGPGARQRGDSGPGALPPARR